MKNTFVLVVHIGTSVVKTIHEELDPLIKNLEEAYVKADFGLAFTSERSIRKLATKGYVMPRYLDVIKDKSKEGYQKIVILPIHLLNSQDYQNLKSSVEELTLQAEITMGRPFIMNDIDGQIMAEAILEVIDDLPEMDSVLMVGHGLKSEVQVGYKELGTNLQQMNPRIYMTTLEDDFDTVMRQMKRDGVTTINLLPLFTVSGYHVHQDLLAGDDSMLERLVSEGFSVRGHSKGLVTYAPIVKILLKRLD